MDDSRIELCGCRGKPSFERRIHPAIKSVNEVFSCECDEPSRRQDVGIINDGRISERVVDLIRGGDPEGGNSSNLSAKSGSWVSLSGLFVGEDTVDDIDSIANFIINSYRLANIPGSSRIAKGHSVFVQNLPNPIQFFEHIRTSSSYDEGHLVSNIDFIHEVPGQTVESQIRIAISNALNDLYTVGAHEQTTLRPIYLTASGSQEVNLESVLGEIWPDNINQLDTVEIEHQGKGEIFGATAVASINHHPPNFWSEIEQGDKLLVHRKIGCLASFISYHSEFGPDGVPNSVLEVLERDHVEISRVISNYCPKPSESFDAGTHLKVVSDISGEGLRVLEDFVDGRDLDVRLTELPIFHREIVDLGQDQWLLPDITIETNGPLLMCGSEEVIQQVKRDLEQIQYATPSILGGITQGEGAVHAMDELRAERYIEWIHNS